MRADRDGALVRRLELELPPPTAAEHAGDLDRLLRALEARGLPAVRAPLPLVAALPGVLRSGGFRASVTVALEPGPALLRIDPPGRSPRPLGLAVDLGSTNVVAALLDLESGEELGELAGVNPQVAIGEDILTRTHAAAAPGGLARLQEQAVTSISGLAGRLAGEAGVAADAITAVAVAGNTTMGHLLLGLDPAALCRAPYVPVANRFPVVEAAELGLAVHPRAPVLLLPNVGSYAGGDALAGALVAGMHEREGISLLVDIGTNAEIVVGNRDFLLVGAGSAGPGLEGGVVRDGMRAAPGAIERVAVDPVSLLPAWSVIGGGAPRGICGSGLIDLVAGLFVAGVVDARGKFVLPPRSPRVRRRDGAAAYVLAEAAESATGAELALSQPDLDNLMLSKAAMYTMLTVMTEAAGVRFEELERFCIAGAFGAYVAADKAVTIGMVPELPLERFRLLGNTALAGARRALLSGADREALGRIARMATYVEMTTSAEFMARFTAARFLPHTDLGRFPGVAARLAGR